MLVLHVLGGAAMKIDFEGQLGSSVVARQTARQLSLELDNLCARCGAIRAHPTSISKHEQLRETGWAMASNGGGEFFLFQCLDCGAGWLHELRKDSSNWKASEAARSPAVWPPRPSGRK
jgi:hypothetical protein